MARVTAFKRRPRQWPQTRRRARRLRVPLVPLLLLIGGVAGAGYSFWRAGSASVWFQSEAVPFASFRLCGRPPHRDCVIDGDTFDLGSQSIRCADIDAPETHPPRCDYEGTLGNRAARRLHDLLNAGPFELRGSGADQYGRALRTVHRDGRSLGGILVPEGLARQWTGRRLPWCA